MFDDADAVPNAPHDRVAGVDMARDVGTPVGRLIVYGGDLGDGELDALHASLGEATPPLSMSSI